MDDEVIGLTLDPRSEVADDRYEEKGAGWAGSVLLADEIEYYCTTTPPIIDPYEPERFRPASYQLTLGRELHLGGVHKILSESEPLKLDRHQVAVVSTRETIRVPRFLIARWSLRVGMIYQGLLWTGGPQVDPGWSGQLFCPIYNLAEREIELKFKDPFFTIDFAKTTLLSERYLKMREETQYKKTWFVPERKTLAEHDTDRLHSAPYEALRDLSELTEFRRFGAAAIGVAFVALAAIVAALSAMAIDPVATVGGPLLSAWPMTALVFSWAATALSVGAIVLAGLLWKRMRR